MPHYNFPTTVNSPEPRQFLFVIGTVRWMKCSKIICSLCDWTSCNSSWWWIPVVRVLQSSDARGRQVLGSESEGLPGRSETGAGASNRPVGVGGTHGGGARHVRPTRPATIDRRWSHDWHWFRHDLHPGVGKYVGWTFFVHHSKLFLLYETTLETISCFQTCFHPSHVTNATFT